MVHMLGHFDAADILFDFTNSKTAPPLQNISVKILVAPIAEKALLPWSDLADPSLFPAADIDEPSFSGP